MHYFNLVDFVYGPMVLIIIVILARVKKYRRIETEPEFKYYTKGLYVKLLGGIALCLIYSLYYGGGDTVNYMKDSLCMLRLLFSNPTGFLHIYQDGVDLNTVFYLSAQTGYPTYGGDKA